MSDLPDGVIYDDLTEAYIVDLGDDTVAKVMGRRRGQKAIELSNMLAKNARLEALLAEARVALATLIDHCAAWDEAVEKIIGRQSRSGWLDKYRQVLVGQVSDE